MANPNPEPHPENLKPPWKQGDVPNPKGRPSAGINAQEWLNALQDTPEDELRRIASNKQESPIKRGAANRLLLFIERTDLADFEEVLDGAQSLKQVRESGINTEVLKKVKVKTRTIPGRNNEADTIEVEREIELHNRSGEEFDRICDRTDGKPNQRMTHDGDIGLRTQADGLSEADQIIGELRKLLGAAAERADQDPPAT